MLMRANIQAVSLKIQTLKSQNAMAQAMKGVTKAMMNMNKQMKLPEIQKIMQEFEKQSEIMDMKEEMMSDVIDDALGDEDDEEESDAIVSQVTEIVNGVTFTLQQVSKSPLPRFWTSWVCRWGTKSLVCPVCQEQWAPARPRIRPQSRQQRSVY